ncbi:DUF21 domain-containing protein At4g14240 [Selaginella moellendorffii]|nr:DUF21 domain-containing protein At4g14240 [Selaginella moellendorffii]|eukprot:XP_002965481.2 DUF21 domain-containing protein At4g14240 [Selaginella moellendorffii]
MTRLMRILSVMVLATSTRLRAEDVPFGTGLWYIYAGISTFLVVFAGLMSGLTLGLMSLGVVDLEVLQRSGTPKEKRQAAAIFPVVQKQHQLLVTLLLCNSAAMEALPIFLDKMFDPVTAVILSVTFVLAFGEVLPQAICARYGLAIGANLVWLVKVLMVVCYPISYPVGKLLDAVLGPHDSLFRRPQLKALVSIHAMDAGRGGELTHDEATIISGALDLTEKTAEEAMTPVESTFSLEVNSKLDWEAMGRILARGHSRVPVFAGSPRNIIGLLLVKSLLTVRPEAETPVSAVSIRKIPRVPADMPLYDILNEFQKGNSHMAAVVKAKMKRKPRHTAHHTHNVNHEERWSDGPKQHDDENGKAALEKNETTIDVDATQPKPPDSRDEDDPGDDLEDGEVIGIITLEDVIEELLQEEIVDETDEYVDVHRRIRVAAGSVSKVATSVRRVGSSYRVLGPTGAKSNINSQVSGGSPNRFVLEADCKQNAEKATHKPTSEGLTEPLLGNGGVVVA